MIESERSPHFEVSIPDELLEYKATLKQHIRLGPNEDAFNVSSKKAQLFAWEYVEPVLARAIATRRLYGRDLKPQLLVNNFTIAVNKMACEIDPERFPIYFDSSDSEVPYYQDPQAYVDLFSKFLLTTAPEENQQKFFYDITERDVGSNPVARAKIMWLMLIAYSDRLDKASIGDGGSSSNTLLNTLSMSAPLSHTQVMKNILGKLFYARTATQAVSVAQHKHPRIGPSIGFDLADGRYDSETRAWIRAGTITPKEIASSIRSERLFKAVGGLVSDVILSPRAEYELVTDPMIYERNSRVGFVRIDLTKQDDVADFIAHAPDNYPDTGFNVMNLSTILQQQTQKNRHRILASADALLAPDGVLISTEFGSRPNPNNPDELIFDAEDIYQDRWIYRTHAKDKLNPNGWQHMATWETGRPERLILGAGKISVNGELRSLKQQLGLTMPQRLRSNFRVLKHKTSMIS